MVKLVLDKKQNNKIIRHLFLTSTFFILFIIILSILLAFDVYCLVVGLVADRAILNYLYRALGCSVAVALILLARWLGYKKHLNRSLNAKSNVEYNYEIIGKRVKLFANNGDVSSFGLTDITKVYETKEFIVLIMTSKMFIPIIKTDETKDLVQFIKDFDESRKKKR
ncbi:MAG: YcxB family protein [Clostridia bacterium]|nr:YcxB family protein [Clostridia bacterium]